MAPGNRRKAFKETGDVNLQTVKKKKKKKYQKTENYGPYFCKLLKRVCPGTTLSVKAINVLNSFGHDMFKRIATEASHVARKHGHATIVSNTIQTAVKIVLPRTLAKNAIECGVKAVIKYNLSKMSCSIKKPPEEEEKWFKCLSKKKNMNYYWNTKTKDSYWNPPLGVDPLDIIDTTEEMRKEATSVEKIEPVKNQNEENVTVKNVPEKNEIVDPQSNEDDDDDYDIEFTPEVIRLYKKPSLSTDSGYTKFEGNCTSSGASSKGSSTNNTPTDAKFKTSFGYPLKLNAVGENGFDRRSLDSLLPAVSSDTEKVTLGSSQTFGLNSASRSSFGGLPSNKRLNSSNEENESRTKYRRTEMARNIYQREFKTPMQDRLLEKKEDLLRKQKESRNWKKPQEFPQGISPSTSANTEGKGKDKNTLLGSLNWEKSLTRPQVAPPLTVKRKAHTAKKECIDLPLPNWEGPKVVPRAPLLSSSVSEENTEKESGKCDPWVRKVWENPPPILAPAPLFESRKPVQEKVSELQSSSQFTPGNSDYCRLRGKELGQQNKSLLDESRKRVVVDEVQAKVSELQSSSQFTPGNSDYCRLRGKELGQQNKSLLDESRKRVVVDEVQEKVSELQSSSQFTPGNSDYCRLRGKELGQQNKSLLDESRKRVVVDEVAPGCKRKRTTAETPDESANTLTLDSTPRQVVDLRETINKRKIESADKTQCKFIEELEMEWEDIETPPEMRPPSRSIKDRLYGSHKIACSTPVVSARAPQYKHVCLVCDTNILINNISFVEKIAMTHTLVGCIPVTVIIPHQVFRELDNIKTRSDGGVAARAAIRMIRELAVAPGSNLILQGRVKGGQAVEGLVPTTNDDFVLNCCLQQKEEYGDEKHVVLLTEDQHLAASSESEQIPAFNIIDLLKWARRIKQEAHLRAQFGNSPPQTQPSSTRESSTYNRQQLSDMDVDIDLSDPLSSFKTPSVRSSVEEDSIRPRKDISNIPKNDQIQSSFKFFVGFIKEDFKMFLKNVLNEHSEHLYGNLKEHSGVPRASWTLIQYLAQIRSRWTSITKKSLSSAVINILSKIINLIKKCNSGKEDLTEKDVRDLFESCQTLAKEFTVRYQTLTGNILQRLADLEEEWEENYKNLVCGSKAISVSEEDAQPADIALQSIFTRMKYDYELVKNTADKKDSALSQRMLDLFSKMAEFIRILKAVLDTKSDTLTIENEDIRELQKMVTVYQGESDEPLTFPEITTENVLVLFKEVQLRKGVHEILSKFKNLQYDVGALAEELDEDDCEFKFF